MYKLVLIDDEAEVREGIIKKVDFTAIGFECVGQAENGVEGLELIESVDPDIAIIDIKMPYMDGIELSQILHRKFPALNVIILSGFDEFEFAQKAIKYNVMEYVLKPISSKDIVELLTQAKLKLDQDRFNKRNLLNLRKHYMESLPIIRERFLNALVLEKHSIKDLEIKLDRYDINLGQPDFITAIVKCDLNETQIMDEELYAYGVNETCKELYLDREGVVFQNHALETVLVLSSNQEPLIQLEEIRANIQKKHAHTVSIGMGEAVETLNDLYKSYNGAQRALSYRSIESGNKILWIKDLDPKQLDQYYYEEQLERDLINTIRSYNLEEINKILNGIFSDLQEKNISRKDFNLFITELLMSYSKLMRQYDLTLEWFSRNTNIFKHISNLDIPSVENLCLKLAHNLSEEIQSTRKNTIRVLMEDAKKYIEDNYSDFKINLETISDYLHLSPEYLSRQFKKFNNTTVIQYLTELRMRKAKELIEDSNLKNFQIAEKVGYSEPNYFSYAYKKYYDISPSQYRKSLRN